MHDADRFRLLGKYCTPRVRIGRRVRCLVRGWRREVLITEPRPDGAAAIQS